MPTHVEFGAIDLPAIAWRHVTERLRIKFPGQRSYSKFLHSVGDYLGALVVGAQCGLIILADENLERLEHAKDGFLADLAATADTIFLGTHVEQGIAHQLLLADEHSGGLR